MPSKCQAEYGDGIVVYHPRSATTEPCEIELSEKEPESHTSPLVLGVIRISHKVKIVDKNTWIYAERRPSLNELDLEKRSAFFIICKKLISKPSSL